jgi:hypothetical protein
MTVSSSAAAIECFVTDDFRRKFVDEENYIETAEWEEYQSAVINVVQGDKGETFRKGDRGFSNSLGPKIPKTLAERSEACDQRVIGLVRGADAAHQPPTRRVNLEAMRSGATQIRKARLATNAALKATVKLRLVKQPIDWSKLDQVGRPVVSFDPFNSERPRLIKVLKRDSRDSTRQVVVRKLGVEFSRIYERYRRDAERRAMGINTHGLYEVQGDRERRACEEAAIQCVFRAVTPRQVLEYWDKNIVDYTGGNLTIPPLGFLKSASAIDRVAVSRQGTVSKMERLKKPTETPRIRATDRNTFSGTDGLDVRLRTTLESNGFKTQAYNDRYLLSIQHNALAVAGGKSIFLAGKMRDMVMIAVEHLYADV